MAKAKQKPKKKPKSAPEPKSNRFSDTNLDLVTIRDKDGKPVKTK